MNALKFLLKSRHLSSTNPDVICRACQDFGVLKEPLAVQPLSHLLDHKDLSVRKAAIGALGQIGSPNAIGVLVRALATPGQRDWWEILASLDAADKNWRQSQVARDVVPSLISAFPRIEAIFAAGEIEDPRAVEPLLRLLEDKISAFRPYDYENFTVISYAIAALGRIGDTRAFESLLQQVLNNGQWVWQAIEALGQLGDPRAIPALVGLLRAEGFLHLSSAVRALLQLGWQPESIADEARVAVVKEDWTSVTKLGAAAIEPLVSQIGPDTKEEAWRTLQQLGEPHTTRALSLLKREASVRLLKWAEYEPPSFPPGKLKCDLCGQRGSGVTMFRIGRAEFRFIVRIGYNPFASGRISSGTLLASTLEAGRKGGLEDVVLNVLAAHQLERALQKPEDAYLQWRRDLVERSTTEWVLCNACLDDVKAFTQTP